MDKIGKSELTDGRPENYSYWHRASNKNIPSKFKNKGPPHWCYMWDIDWVEGRKNDKGKLEPIALIETINVEDPFSGDKTNEVWESKKNIYLRLQEKADILFFVVWHSPNCNKFLVKRYYTEDNKVYKWVGEKMNEEEYIKFLKNLPELPDFRISIEDK